VRTPSGPCCRCRIARSWRPAASTGRSRSCRSRRRRFRRRCLPMPILHQPFRISPPPRPGTPPPRRACSSCSPRRAARSLLPLRHERGQLPRPHGPAEREHYICVSLDRIADWIEGRAAMPARAVCITFDGPYQGHYTYAAPILREHGFFATSYITTDWIGTANHADWHQLAACRRTGLWTSRTTPPTTPRTRGCRGRNDPAIAGLATTPSAGTWGQAGHAPRLPQRGIQRWRPPGARRTGLPHRDHGGRRPVRKNDDPLLLPRYTLTVQTTPEQFLAWLTNMTALFSLKIWEPSSRWVS